MNVLEKKPDPGRKELAGIEIRRYEKLESARKQVFDSAWQTLSGYFLPNLSDINEDKLEDSTGWADRVFDTTGIEDARTCTTGQSNWATPAAEKWFQWAPPESLGLEAQDEAALWLGNATDVALKILARSNYYRVSGMQYKSRTVFGTGHLHMEEGRDSLINCRCRKIGTFCVAQNADGIVDTVYTRFKLTVRQAAQEFGAENLGGKVKRAFEQKDGKGLDQEFWFLHVIRPRDEIEREPGRIDAQNKAIASIYVQMEDKFVCRLSGYDEMPDSVTRFDEWGSESVWGYSPAFESLPNARQLNYIVRFEDAQAELRANPRILQPIDLFGQIDLRPGGVTPFDPNKPNSVPKEWMTQADLKTTQEICELKRKAMHRLFYTDVFTMLQQIDRKMTAYEIAQRVGEKLEQLSPMFGRIVTEKCDVDLRRIFGILFRAGKFGKPPRSLMVRSPDGKTERLVMPEVTYTSRLALALKALQNRATVDTFTFLSEFAANTQRPELLDNFDLDGSVRRYALNQGMSAADIRPLDKVRKLREQRAQQMAQQRALDMAEQVAGAAGKLGKAPEKIKDAVSEQIAPAA